MTTLFTNGNLVDVIGQTVLTGGSILVENGMIKEVGTSIAAPDGAKVVDLGGRTVLPGLFNCHVHMCSDAGTGAKETISDAAVTIRALKNLKTLLNSGVTYIRDAGAPKYIDVDLHDAQLKGEILAPEMQTACRCICMTGGHGHDSGREADGPDDCRRAAREQLKAGANWIKVMATGGVMTKGVEPGSPQLTEEELRAAIEEAHKAGAKTFTHAQGMEGIKNALRAMLGQMIGQAIEENNEKLSQDISCMVNDKVIKEVDYLMRVADERDEERFRQLDETIRLYQRENKGKAEAAASRIPFFSGGFGKKKKFGRNGNKL